MGQDLDDRKEPAIPSSVGIALSTDACLLTWELQILSAAEPTLWSTPLLTGETENTGKRPVMSQLPSLAPQKFYRLLG